MRNNEHQMMQKIKPLNDKIEILLFHFKKYIINNNCFNHNTCFVCFIFDIEITHNEHGSERIGWK